MVFEFDRSRIDGFRPLESDVRRSPTLPGFLYSDPSVFTEERRRIFDRSWQLIAHESELPEPGCYVAGQIVEEPVFVVRQRDGGIAGFYNVCQHRAHKLVTGRGQVKKRLVCPYHAWCYDLDGTHLPARLTREMPGFDAAGFGLKTVRVEVALGFVFVNLDAEAPSLAEVAGDMFDDMAASLPWLDEVRVDTSVTDSTAWEGSTLAANWKVLAENCLECYHCGPAHRDFVDLIDMQDYRYVAHGNWLKSRGRLLKCENSAYTVDSDEPVQEAVFWHLWPNMEFSVLPGGRALGGFRFTPTDPNTTVMNSIMLTVPGETIAAERLRYRWEVLWPEDEAICLSVHQGLKSRGYRQGRFVSDEDESSISEHAVHKFQLRYAEAMGLL